MSGDPLGPAKAYRDLLAKTVEALEATAADFEAVSDRAMNLANETRDRADAFSAELRDIDNDGRHNDLRARLKSRAGAA